MNRQQFADTIRSLLRSGLTVRDVAEMFRVDPRAIEALLSR